MENGKVKAIFRIWRDETFLETLICPHTMRNKEKYLHRQFFDFARRKSLDISIFIFERRNQRTNDVAINESAL